MSARIIVGVRMSSVIRIEEVQEKVKRFNQFTGEPHMATETKKRWFWMGQEISELDLSSKIYSLGSLGVFFTCSPYSQLHCDDSAIGVVLRSVYDGECTELPMNSADIETGIQKLNELIPGIKGPFSLFLHADERWS